MGQEFSQAFERDGVATKILETIPFVGFGVMHVHAACGHQEHARRAAAKCGNASLQLLGTLAAGCVPGAGLAAGLAAGAGMGVAGNAMEAAIAENHIKDEGVREGCADHSAEEYLKAAAFGAVAGGMGGVAGLGMREAGASPLKQVVGEFAAEVVFADAPYMAMDLMNEKK